MTQAPSVHLHQPKVELFNVAESTNTDPKGFIRPVDTYHVEPWGLYMARTADHHEFHYLESWLLPSLGVRATKFHFRPYSRRDQDCYLDIGEFGQVGPQLWKSVDHYLDIVTRAGREAELLDVDELLAAHAAGLISGADAQAAIAHATTAIDALARHDYRLEAWLATLDMPITWQN